MPSWHVWRKLYLYLRQTEGKFSVSNKYYRVMDKSKLSEPAYREVRLLKPSQISELTMDSIFVRLESNTMTAEEEVVKNLRWCRSYNESIHSLLVGYAECRRAQVTHGHSFTQCP